MRPEHRNFFMDGFQVVLQVQMFGGGCIKHIDRLILIIMTAHIMANKNVGWSVIHSLVYIPSILQDYSSRLQAVLVAVVVAPLLVKLLKMPTCVLLPAALLQAGETSFVRSTWGRGLRSDPRLGKGLCRSFLGRTWGDV